MTVRPEVSVELAYDLVENGRGELMLVIAPRAAAPVEPCLKLGSNPDEAIFWRTPESAVWLTHIHPDVRGKLCAAPELLVVEGEGAKVRRVYSARVTPAAKS